MKINFHRKEHMNFITIVSTIVMIVYMNFYSLFSLIHLSGAAAASAFLLCLAILGWVFGKNIRISKSMIYPFLLWSFFLIFQFIDILHNDYAIKYMFRQMAFFIIWIVIFNQFKLTEHILAWIIGIGFINVLATFFFYLNPSAYNIMLKIYGFVPPGTVGGTLGYRAGLADHYSQNSIFISIIILGLGSVLVTCLNEKNKGKSHRILVLFILFILSTAAMLLTAKRGPLVFSVFALIIVYFIGNKENFSKNIFRFTIIVLTLVALTLIAINYIPELSVTFERLGDSGDDDNSQARFEMWELAFRIFKENPIIGKGTYSYREEYAVAFPSLDDRYSKLNTHNVYIQVLAENGIIGFGLFLLSASITVFQTVRLIFNLKKWKSCSFAAYATALFALSMQVYFFIYSITGNCLYDIVFAYYCCSIAIVNAVYLNRSHFRPTIIV